MTRVTANSLAKDIDQFLAFKRALGYSYGRNEATLRSFQRFACRNRKRTAQFEHTILVTEDGHEILTLP